MANEGKKDLDFKKAPDESRDIDGKSSSKSEERKESNAEASKTTTQEAKTDNVADDKKGLNFSDVDLSSFQTKGEATGQLSGETGAWSTAPERNVAPDKFYPSQGPSEASASMEQEPSTQKKGEKEIKSAKVEKDDSSIKAEDKSDNSPSAKGIGDIKVSKKAEALTHSDSILGPEIPDPVDNRTEEEKVLGDAWERSVEKSTPEIKKEDPTKETFEIAKAEWRDKRKVANELEADYARGYEKHVLESSKKLSSLPRRMFGLKPKLTPELQKLKDEADNARKDFNKSANSFLMSDGAERFRTRLEPKVAATLPYVHQQRREGQDRIVAEGWGENKNLRRALEALGKHKYKLTATAIGVSALTTGGVLPVLAAMGAGLIVRGATKEGLTATYVESARTRLKDARKAIGENFLSKSYEEMNEEMENLTFLVGAREARTQTAAAVAGIAAGFGTAGYASGLGVEGSVPDVTSSSPEIIPGAPNHAGMIPDSGVSFDTTTPEGQVALKEYLMEHFKDNPEVLEQIQGTSPEGVAKGMERYYEESTGMDSDAEPAVKTQPRVIPETPATPESAPAPQSNGEDLGVDHEPVEDGDYGHEPNEEDVFAEPAVTHTVERGDNAWNIMEGKGPDNNPVGGKSDVLEGMSLQERRYWLDKVFDYCDQYPDFAEKVGAVKSGGNIHLIHPGETINVSMLDEKIVELMNQEAGNNVPVPTPRPEDIVSGEPVTIEKAPADESIVNKLDDSMSGTAESAVSEKVTDFNDLTIQEVEKMASDIAQNNPEVEARLEELGIDKNDFKERYEIIGRRAGELRPDMTVSEWLTNSDKNTDDLPPPANDNSVPEATPFSGVLPQPGDMPVRDASFNPEAVASDSEAVRSYVNSVENPKIGLFDRLFLNTNPNITGTWEALNPNQMTVGQFKEMVSSPNLEVELTSRNLSAEGVTKWGETLQKQSELIPANDNETLTQYLSRVTSGQRVA